MTEFGHTGRRIPGFGCIDSWGWGPFIITVGDKSFRFEDSDQFGPSLVAKDGRILDRQPAEKSPFWKAHRAWKKQGRRMADDGVACVYNPLKDEVYRIGVGNQLIVVQQGDDGGDSFVEAADGTRMPLDLSKVTFEFQRKPRTKS